jgi:predicted Zn-dependent protease
MKPAMVRSILRDLVILLGVFGLVWLAASLFNYPEKPSLLSVEQEEKMGEAYMDLILLNPMFRELDNDRVDSAVGVIGMRLLEGLRETEYSYKFTVFNSEMINAFTVPGGNILVSSGLIAFCEKPEELAAVMAHEMGHVEERHVVSRLVKELGIGILTSGDQYVLGEVTGLLTSASFDRKQEEEADRFASGLLEKSGIEPRTLATLFRRLDEETGNELLDHFEIVSDHPNFHSRIRAALSCQPGEDFSPRPIDLDWQAVKSGIE